MNSFKENFHSYTTKVIKELERKDDLLYAVANASNELITNENFETAVFNALKILGEATKVDRCYIFENHLTEESNKPATSQRFEWSIDRVEPQIDNPDLQNIPFEEAGLLWWYESLINNEPINSLVKDLPQGGRDALEPQGIISLLIIPIYIGKQLWGFIGFDDCQVERTWSKTEESILTAVAASFGGMVKRRKTEQDLQKTLHQLSNFNEKLEERVATAISDMQQKDLLIQQQSRQVAMGEIINSIAHQWRQPLNAISLTASNISLDAELTQDFEEISKQADKIIELAESMSRTITDFMEFFNENQNRSQFSIREAFKNIFELIQSQRYSRNIHLNENYCSNDYVITYRNDLQQVLVNILTNAMQAFDRQGNNDERTITVATNNIMDRTLGECIEISIIDNAGGIAQQHLDKIFQPYFTTKPKGKGTGIGLSISKKLIEERIKGTISVENEKDGAKFTIKVPVTNDN